VSLISFLGAPQIAAILILAQRGLEELYSARNTNALLAKGAREAGRAFYPVVAVTHLAWIFGLYLLIPPEAPVYWSLIGVYLLLQPVRYWVIWSLGPYWTHRIITLKDTPLVQRGPYKAIRHPNYIVAVIETALLPLAFGAWAYALILTAIWAVVLSYKIHLEDTALVERREISAADFDQA